MMRRESSRNILLVGGLAALGLVWTTRVADRADASPAPKPFASPKSTADEVKDTAEKVGDKVAEGAKKAGEAVKDAAQETKKKAGPTAEKVVEKTKEAAKETGAFVDAKAQSVDVKTALMADKSVDASDIDVDSDPGTKTITLKGTVPTVAQRTAAARIAHEKAEGYHVRNMLTVVPAPKTK